MLAQNLPAEQPSNEPAHEHFVFISVRTGFFFPACGSNEMREFKQLDGKVIELQRVPLSLRQDL